MKNVIFVFVCLLFLVGCNTNESDTSMVQPIAADGIVSVSISGTQVSVTTIYGTGSSCWYYYRTESTNNGSVYTSKVYAKDDGNPCAQVISYFKHEEKITFYTKGTKTLRFWRNDTTYLDTTITLY